MLVSGIMNLIAAICFIVFGLNDGTNIIWLGIALIFAVIGASTIGKHIKYKK